MDESRQISERSRSVVRRSAQVPEVTGSRPVVHRVGGAKGGVSAGEGLAEGREVSVVGDGLAPAVRILKAPEGYGADIRAIFEQGKVRMMKGAVVRDVQAVQGHLQQACEEAKRIVVRAGEDVERALRDAREQGRREAFAEVLEELGRARGEYEKLMGGAEADMIELAFQIARQIIGHSIDVDPKVLRDIVAKSLVHVRGKRQIVVLVHPEDLVMIDGFRGELAQEVEGAALYFGADPEMERGGCVIETESGRLDARLDVQLDTLREILLKGGK